MKEKLLAVYEVPEAQEGDLILRIPVEADKDPSTTRLDRETGEPITLWEEKMRYPYKVVTKFKIVVKTTERVYEFPMKMDKGGSYFYNGSNIPSIFWTLLGISKDSPQGWLPSMAHDNILQYKAHFYRIAQKYKPDITVPEFRKLTSRIYENLLINNKVNFIKAKVMGFCINCYQYFNPDWNEL